MRCSKCGAENSDRVKFCMQCASPFARRQQASSFLRASISLARRAAREAQRSSQNALDIADWFTEGFNITDLKEAKALLEESSGG